MAVYNYVLRRYNRSKWVKNLIANRNIFGHMTLLRELSTDEPKDLKNYLRMSASDFHNFVRQVIFTVILKYNLFK